MNKRLIILLFSLATLLVISLLVIGLIRNDPSNINDKPISPLGITTGDVATSSNNFSCPVNQVPVTVTNLDGTKKIFCSSANDPYPIGTGKETYSLNGYYSTYNITMYPFDYDSSRDPLPATTTCSNFTVIGGDNDFIKVFKNIIQDGNTVNKINKNNLVLNIDISNLKAYEKNIVVNSNPEHPITLKVNVRSMGGRDANYCESSIRIISAN